MLPFNMRDAIIASVLTSSSHTIVLSVYLSAAPGAKEHLSWQVSALPSGERWPFRGLSLACVASVEEAGCPQGALVDFFQAAAPFLLLDMVCKGCSALASSTSRVNSHLAISSHEMSVQR